MLSQTLKLSLSVIKDSMESRGYYTQKSSFKKEVILIAEEVVRKSSTDSPRTYTFTITSKGIDLSITSGNLSYTQKVFDIEMFKLPKFFKIKQLSETSYTKTNDIYSHNMINVKHEAQFFVSLFKIMKERVYFTVLLHGSILDCYYIDGKVFYVEETEDQYRLKGTDLYKIFNTHGNHYVCTISSLLDQFSYSTFLEEQNRIASAMNKELVKYRYDQVV